MAELDPDKAAEGLAAQFIAQGVEQQTIKIEGRNKRASHSVYNVAWRRSFIWVFLASPFLGLPFWIFLGLGINRIASKTSDVQKQGRGYLHGGITGFLAAILLWCTIVFSANCLIERNRQIDIDKQAKQDNQDWAQSRNRIAEAETLPLIEDRKFKIEQKRKLEEERLQAELEYAALAVQREAETARFYGEQEDRALAFASQQSGEVARRSAEREKAALEWRTQEEAAAAALAQQDALAEEERVAREHQRMQADIDRYRAEFQESEALINNSDKELARLKSEVAAWTNRYDVAIKLVRQAASEQATNTQKLSADARTASAKLSAARRALSLFESRIQVAESRKDNALRRLQELGVEPIADFPDAPIQPGDVTQKSYVIKLKDGKTINAVMVVDGDDVYSIKTAEGRFFTVKKADVVEMPEALLPKK